MRMAFGAMDDVKTSQSGDCRRLLRWQKITWVLGREREFTDVQETGMSSNKVTGSI